MFLSTGRQGLKLFKADVYNSAMYIYEFSVDCSEGGKSLTTTAKCIIICPGILSGL